MRTLLKKKATEQLDRTSQPQRTGKWQGSVAASFASFFGEATRMALQ